MMKRFVYLIAFFTLCRCSTAPSKQANIPLIKNDPFLESFKGKGLKMAVIAESGSASINDTIFFDRVGNIISKKNVYSTHQYGYDETGNLDRVLSINDIPSNYLIKYEYNKGVVLQTWYLLNHLKWEKENEILDTIDRVVKFEFDKLRNLKQEVNLSFGEITKYEYTDTKMQSKKVFPDNSEVPSIQWTYYYGKKGFLEKVECISHGRLVKEDFYGSDGIIDSTRRADYTLVYTYEYY